MRKKTIETPHNIEDSDATSSYEEPSTSLPPVTAVSTIHGEPTVMTGVVTTLPSTLEPSTAKNTVPSSRVNVTRKTLGTKRKVDPLEEGNPLQTKKKPLITPEKNLNVNNQPLEDRAAPFILPLEPLQTNQPTLKVSIPKLPSKPHHENYHFTVKPLMGSNFELELPHESFVYDVKDAIFEKVGLEPEMQMLSYRDPKVSFVDDEVALEDLPIGKQSTLDLSIRAAAGLQVMSTLTNFSDDEGVFYEVFLPDSQSVNGNNATTKADLSNDEEPNTSEESKSTIPTVEIPLPVLKSYLENQEGVRRLSLQLPGLDALKISISTDEEPQLNNFDTPQGMTKALFDTNISSRNQSSAPKEQTGISLTAAAGPVRCHKCSKKCRLAMQFVCRCGNTFCGEHRYHDQHECSFDHKTHDRQRLSEANLKVLKPQVDRL